MNDFNIKIEYKHVPRFDSGSDKSIDYLESEGYVIIKNALTANEASKTLDLLWDYLENLGTGIDRTNPMTWSDDKWPTCAHGGIIPSYGIGHSEAQWFVRGVPNVKKAFAKVWGTNDLLTSFDGVSLWRPWNIDPSWKTQSGQAWFHIDQHPISKPGKQCIQGLINLLPTSKEIGGNVVIPKSHNFFKDLPEEYKERVERLPLDIDHFRFPHDDPKLSSEPAVMAHMEPGDMLLWDSRTIHCSSSGSSLPDGTNDLIRAASLICMMPKKLSSKEILDKRIHAAENLVSTTNWTNDFRNADEFPIILEAENRDQYKWPKKPNLSDYQKELIA